MILLYIIGYLCIGAIVVASVEYLADESLDGFGVATGIILWPLVLLITVVAFVYVIAERVLKKVGRQ